MYMIKYVIDFIIINYYYQRKPEPYADRFKQKVLQKDLNQFYCCYLVYTH